jgi:crotonobetainyl-CoA:carnitine CoA-transferase CaiB-like acyl-CoA transferase
MAEAVSLLPQLITSEILAGEPVPPGGVYRLAGGSPFYSLYRTADGCVAVAADEVRFRRILLRTAGIAPPDWTRDGDDKRIGDELTAYFSGQSTADVLAAFADEPACVSVVQSYETMLVSDQATERQYVQRESADPMPVLSLPVTVDGRRLSIARGAPRHGEDDPDLGV